MSYIFNNFSKAGGGPPSKFSDVVRQAKEQGYTEPHPGDDLNGSDVARKLCILSRLAGSSKLPTLPQGHASVPIQSLIPKDLEGIASGEEFVKRLADHDKYFEDLRSQAESEGSVLRFVGVIDTQAKVVKGGLEKYPVSHPFAASLGGSDNIISFKTSRYSSRPLIVQGAGAGAAVTAMGVVADCIRVAERVGLSQ